MLPLSDGIPARRFPVVNVALIVANFAVFLLYELPHLNAAVYHASFYPCSVDNACRAPEPWGLSWITAMFLHAGWDHILGNMLFLAIFGKNVEDAFGSLRYLLFYFADGFVAIMTQTAMTLLFGSAADGRVPTLGASGAIATVLGAYFLLYPRSRGPHLDLPGLLPPDPGPGCSSACGSSTSSSRPTSGCSAPRLTAGTAFFAHVGGFLFGLLVAAGPRRAGRAPGGIALSAAVRSRPGCRPGPSGPRPVFQ
jgi:membrane associated rhomboid family serine protease